MDKTNKEEIEYETRLRIYQSEKEVHDKLKRLKEILNEKTMNKTIKKIIRLFEIK